MNCEQLGLSKMAQLQRDYAFHLQNFQSLLRLTGVTENVFMLIQWARVREKGVWGWAGCAGGAGRGHDARGARCRRDACALSRRVRVMRADRAALYAWLVCCAAALSSHKYSTRVVRTKYGPLRGIVVHSHPQVEAYLGVPYATPPLGSLRWVYLILISFICFLFLITT